jgi:hypothetical protein
VTLLDYRGYGGSEGGVTEAGMIADGQAGIAWTRTRADETGSKLVLHLESIGSAAGIGAAARVDPSVHKVDGRGLHSSTFGLNVSMFCGIRWMHNFVPVY